LEPKIILRGEFNLIGISTETSNPRESDPDTAKIAGLWKKFFEENWNERIPNRLNEHLIYGGYTNYESDVSGQYTLIVGGEVKNLETVPDGMTGVVIPAGRYMIFTARGKMPEALISTWQEIWNFFSSQSKFSRAYTADYEVHDRTKSADPSVVEIYIALRQQR
jgi:predicted transcriptional regulator YdeE